MLSVRLPDELESRVKQVAAAEWRTKTQIIRAALEAYIKSRDTARSAYEAGKDLFGRHGSGRGDLSVGYRQKVRTRIHEKHTH